MLPDWVTPYRAYIRMSTRRNLCNEVCSTYRFMTREEFQQVVWC